MNQYKSIFKRGNKTFSSSEKDFSQEINDVVSKIKDALNSRLQEEGMDIKIS